MKPVYYCCLTEETSFVVAVAVMVRAAGVVENSVYWVVVEAVAVVLLAVPVMKSAVGLNQMGVVVVAAAVDRHSSAAAVA